jgi:lysophospholipase L1-like esterase
MNETTVPTMTTSRTQTFFLLGDSICFGQLVSPHRTWVIRLAELLPGIVGGGMLVQNASINGNTTRQALERMTYDITSHSPDYLLVQFGMNDCNYWETDRGVPRVSKAAFSANLLEITERALACGTKHIFLNTNHPSLKGAFGHMPELTHYASNREYNEVIRQTHERMMSEKMPVTLTDIEAAWFAIINSSNTVNLEDLLLEDKIHLSPLGHNLYFDIVSASVAKQLKARN